MQFTVISSSKIQWDKNELFIVLVQPKIKITPFLKKLEKLSKNNIDDILINSNFNGNFGEKILIRSSNKSFLLLGCGNNYSSYIEYEKLGGILYSSIKDTGFQNITIISNLETSSTREKKILPKILFGLELKSYSFLKYKTRSDTLKTLKIKCLTVLSDDISYLKNKIQINQDIISGVFLTKNLTSEPANFLTTSEFVNQIEDLKKIDIEIDILDETRMSDLGMNALLGVGRGSKNKSYLAIMKWNGNPKIKSNIAFVGKGVCFDSGGLSLKTGRGMMDMKEDMGGAGIVVGAMKAIAKQKIKTNVIGVVGLVENMPDANAQRPGDIVKSMSGKTIEILNTDAEGRLVLADALYYTNKIYKPKFIIDLATLTGAIISALGNERAGLFSNNEKLSNNIFDIGEETGDLVWKMPIDPNFGKKMLSKIADLKNIGSAEGSAIQAAAFLENFVGKTPWAHLDVAGVVWLNSNTEKHSGGATGWGVKLLFEIAKKNKF